MIKITITPPNKPEYFKEFSTVSDAIDYILTLHTYGYAGAREAAQQGMQADGFTAVPNSNLEVNQTVSAKAVVVRRRR